METGNLTWAVKEAAKKAGADLVGIAPLARFAGVPPEHHPASIFPDAKAVIVIARRITRGTFRGIEEGTNWQSYALFGYNNLDDAWVAETGYNVCLFLENQGWEGVPIFPHPPEVWPQGVAVAPDRPAPNVIPPFEYAAVAAGLGEIGYAGVFLSPQFGPRQRLGLILTDAPLEGDPLYERPICGLCMQCVEVCPLGAISREETHIDCAGKRMRVAKIDDQLCRRCQNGAFGNRYHERGKPDRLAALCIRTCLAQLEQAGKLENVFHNPFRKRPVWTVDLLGRTEAEKEGGQETRKQWRGCADVGSTAQRGA